MGQPLSVFINSMVIQGEEPMLVDTGSPRNRRAWLEDAFGLVEPKSVKWVFISHEDADHVGNLDQVMDACPNATLVCSWALMERYSSAFNFPLDRCRWMEDGVTFDVGNHQMVVVRPPIYDSPTTRGLFDAKTGVYWASDCFATPVPGGDGAQEFPREVGDLDDEFWSHGLTMFAWNALAPWLRLVDQDRFAAEVRRLSDMPISTVASAHSPIITGPKIAEVLAKTEGLPSTVCPPSPDQAALELFLAATRAPMEELKSSWRYPSSPRCSDGSQAWSEASRYEGFFGSKPNHLRNSEAFNEREQPY
jgi:flavorubredoxin